MPTTFAATATVMTTLIACGATAPPHGPMIEHRLAGEEACTSSARIAAPVPAGSGALMGFRQATGFERATFVCDLPERIIAVAADQRVENGKLRVDGNVWTIPRVGAHVGSPLPPLAIDRGSPGCTEGRRTCTYTTGDPQLRSIEIVGPAAVETSGWIHGAEDLCRALPADTIATCSTATRLIYVELGCATDPQPLQLGIHEAAQERAYDLEVEVPAVRMVGGPDPANGAATVPANGPTRWSFRFTGGAKGGPKAAALTFDLGAQPSAIFEADGRREPCLAFTLARQPPP